MADLITELKFRLFSEGGLCILILLVSATAVLAPLLFLDAFPFAGRVAPQELRDDLGPESGASLTNLELDSIRYFSALRFLNDSARNGESFAWNPGEYAGVPFLAQWWTRGVSPFSLPFHIFDLQLAHAISAFLKLLTAAWLAYYVARILGLSRGFALAVGLSQQLTGYLLLWLHHPVSDVLPWIPLLFLYAERLSLGQTRYWPTGALVIALMLFGGDPLAALVAFTFFACYFAVRVRASLDQPSLLRPLLSALGSFTLALLVSATQLLPFIEWWTHSISLPTTSGFIPNVLHLSSVAVPGWILGPFDYAGQRSAALLFLGPIQILLGCLWFALRRYVALGQRARVDGLFGLSAGCILATIAIAPAASYIPALAEVFRVERLLIACPFALAIGCATTGDAWIRLKPAQCIPAFKQFLRLVLIGIVCIAGTVLLALVGGLRSDPDALFLGIALASCAIAFVALVGLTLIRPRARLFAYGLSALILAQSLLAYAPMLRFATHDELFPNREAIQALESAGGRIGMGPSVTAWQLAAAGIPTFYGTGDRILKEYQSFSERLALDPTLMYRTAPAALLLSKDDLQGTYRSLRPSLHVRKVFGAHAVLFDSPSSSDIARFADSQDHDEWQPLARHLRIAESNTRVNVKIARGDTGTLVFAKAYYPGWRAFIDGHEEPIFPVDDLFMGVDVPEGSSEVNLRYEPESLYWGRIISFLAGAIVLTGVANVFYYRLHDRYSLV